MQRNPDHLRSQLDGAAVIERELSEPGGPQKVIATPAFEALVEAMLRHEDAYLRASGCTVLRSAMKPERRSGPSPTAARRSFMASHLSWNASGGASVRRGALGRFAAG